MYRRVRLLSPPQAETYTQMTDSLPYFAHPPVIESVLGVHFDALKDFQNAHLTLFWQKLGESEWPKAVDTLPLEPVVERFGEEQTWAKKGAGIRVTTETSTRLQIRNARDDRMVQVQNGRFHYNWRKVSPEDEYPRYLVVREEFDSVFERFREFVRERQLGELQPNQWEITYVNHIEQASLWRVPGDWHTVLPGLLSRGPAKAKPESITGKWRFLLEPERGRLHVTLQHAKRLVDPKTEVINLDLTARGPISREHGLDSGLNLGHEAIVNTFVAITSEQAHRHWSKQE